MAGFVRTISHVNKDGHTEIVLSIEGTNHYVRKVIKDVHNCQHIYDQGIQELVELCNGST